LETSVEQYIEGNLIKENLDDYLLQLLINKTLPPNLENSINIYLEDYISIRALKETIIRQSKLKKENLL
jgi:hypothetical protein